jgi:hypothetical protein
MATKHLLRITTSGLVLILLIGTFIEDFAQTKKNGQFTTPFTQIT